MVDPIDSAQHDDDPLPPEEDAPTSPDLGDDAGDGGNNDAEGPTSPNAGPGAGVADELETT